MRLNTSNRERFAERIRGLKADAPPLWGRMSSTDMLAHLRRAHQIALGEVVVEDQSTFALRRLMLPLFLTGWFRIPKAKAETLPVFLPDDALDFETERERCIDSLNRFVAKAAAEPDARSLHPAFGPMTMRRYEKLFGMHVDHHLRQFGV